MAPLVVVSKPMPDLSPPPTSPTRPDGGIVAEPPEERVRRAGGPVDCAVYGCGCGTLFEAEVSASVRCPHCGGEQAW